MRYIINFQIKVQDDETSNDIIRSSYTLLEKDSEKFKLSDITEVENWFKKNFEQSPLEHFIDTGKIPKEKKFNMKIGRITNAISGEYKTF